MTRMAKVKNYPKWFCPVCNKEARGCYIIKGWDKLMGNFYGFIIHYNCLTALVPEDELAKYPVTGYTKKATVAKLKKGLIEWEDLGPGDFLPFDPNKEFVGKEGVSASFAIAVNDKMERTHMQVEPEGVYVFISESSRAHGRDPGGRMLFKPCSTRDEAMKFFMDKGNELISWGYKVFDNIGQEEDYMDAWYEGEF